MKAQRRLSTFLKMSAVAAVTLTAGSEVFADLTSNLFFNDVNRLVGDPRRGTDEDYTNSAGGGAGEYLSPSNFWDGTAQVAGSQPGHIESHRLGLGGSVGINTPQPHNTAGQASDIRNAYENRLNPGLEDGPDGLSGTADDITDFRIWAPRAGAAVQWQSNQDGSTNFLTPDGSVQSKTSGLTPAFLSGAAVGVNGDGSIAIIAPVDNSVSLGAGIPGTAPGSATGDVFTDFVPWKLEIGDPTTLVTGFDLTALDPDNITASAASFAGGGPGISGVGGVPLAGAALAAAIEDLSARIDVRENGALYDQVLGSHDEDNFDHNSTGTNSIVGDELENAVDGPLLLSGLLFDVNIENRWVADRLSLDPGPDGITGTLDDVYATDTGPDGFLGTADDIFIADPTTVRRTLSVSGDVRYDSGLYVDNGWLGNIGPSGLPEGTFSASWTDILFANTTGSDGDGVYDFQTGDPQESYSGDLVFTLIERNIVPEPVTSSLSLLALGGLATYLKRRR